LENLYKYNRKKDDQTMLDTNSGKIKKQQFVENLREGDVVNDIYAVKIKNPPRQYKKGVWFDLVIIDKTGEIFLKYWGGENKDRVKKLYDSFKIGDVIQVRLGNVEIFADKPQISINESVGSIRRCKENEYNIADFIKSLEKHKIEEFIKVVKNEISNVQNTDLKNLLELFFSDSEFINDFCSSPSAITHHHNYVGGNLEHTVGVIRLCKNICEMYEGINKDLVIAGAILHDIGKLKEYGTKAAIEKTDQGNFIGHIVIGDRWIREKIVSLREKGKEFDSNLEDKLCHIMLSHHGRYEYGSPRMPKTIEAMVVHAADLMDSQVKNFIQVIEEGRKASEDEWAYIWDSDMGQKRPMYLRED
jgi:3'-5' exoribonuclease